MKKEFSISDSRFPVENREGKVRRSSIANGFTLVEVLVVVALLSLIVVALMAVFNTTQTAFRASVTQSDILEGGRSAMDLMTGDLREMSPSLGANNGAMNFCVTNYGYPPLDQSLTASSNTRTNVQENFFILSRKNQDWTGTGYVVITNSAQGNLYSLYRFSMTMNVSASNSPAQLYTDFLNTDYTISPPWSRLIDGVVGLRVHAFDLNGALINTNVLASLMRTNSLPNLPGETGYVFYGNALPASVEIEMAVLEDRALQRAESLPDDVPAPPNDRRTLYLQEQAGKVHIFRQRVSIPNVDPAAYQ